MISTYGRKLLNDYEMGYEYEANIDQYQHEKRHIFHKKIMALDNFAHNYI